MKIKTKIQDLTDAQANEWCARARKLEILGQTYSTISSGKKYLDVFGVLCKIDGQHIDYTPTTTGAQAFELIDSLGEFGIDVWNHHGNKGARVTSDDGINMFSFTCGTPDGLARAIVNAVIASVYGESVEVSDA